MSLAIVLAAPVVGMGIGSFFAFSAIGSNVLNIPDWSWISFFTSIFVAIPALAFSKHARKHSKTLLVYPAVLSSIAVLGIMERWSGTGPMVEAMDTLAGFVGTVLIGVIPLIVAIGLLWHAWPDVTAKQLSQNSTDK